MRQVRCFSPYSLHMVEENRILGSRAMVGEGGDKTGSEARKITLKVLIFASILIFARTYFRDLNDICEIRENKFSRNFRKIAFSRNSQKFVLAKLSQNELIAKFSKIT